MPSRTLGVTLMSAGLVAALSDPSPAPRAEPGYVAADTVSVAAPPEVTMEPIRVVVSREERLESVTMEPIRVVVSREERLESVTMKPIRVVIPREVVDTPAEESAPER